MKKDYYVYEHRRATDGSVFYVGKGRGRRAYSKCSRNKHWHSIVKNNGYTVHFLYEGISESNAIDLEIKIIGAYGDSLCNMTSGGDGLTGRNEEVIKSISEKIKNKWNDDEYRRRVVGSLTGRSQSKETRNKRSKSMTGKVRSEEHCRNLSKALKGLKKPEGYGEKVSKLKKGKMAGDKNPSFDWTLRFFYSESECIIATAWHFSKLKNLKRHNVDNLIRGKCNSHNGWSYGGII